MDQIKQAKAEEKIEDLDIEGRGEHRTQADQQEHGGDMPFPGQKLESAESVVPKMESKPQKK